MKKTLSSKSRRHKTADMLPEYSFDYRKAKPNRFAGQISKERLVVLLDPEVAEVFDTPESVNAILRAVVAALPKGSKRKAKDK